MFALAGGPISIGQFEASLASAILETFRARQTDREIETAYWSLRQLFITMLRSPETTIGSFLSEVLTSIPD